MVNINAKFALFLAAGFTISIMLMSLGQPQKSKPWVIPEKFKTMKNTVATSDASVKTGEALYRKNCLSCHGRAGLGDGIKAKTIETFPGDLTSTEFQSQTDGILFYQSKFGRNEMPKYENKIEDADLWALVNFMRTFKK